MTRHFFTAAALTAALLLFVVCPVHAQKRIEQPVKDAIDIRQKTQQAEEKWRDEKQERLARLEELQAEREQLQSRKDEMQLAVDTTRQRLNSKKTQLSDIGQISGQIRPFLDETAENLNALGGTDLPFLPEERSARMKKLEALLADPSVETSEKYRKVMEALLVEAEYGFTTGTYQQTIAVEGQKRLVNVFRLGRISLFYMSLDREQCGFYNIAEKQWQPLSRRHLPAVSAAVDIAAKRQTAELLTLPLGRLVTQ